ncbi:MAG: hypothetical protein PWP49_248 [Thermococcaceae archaeon]|nr:hypothetical protein [Thermococcaceae archaeon]
MNIYLAHTPYHILLTLAIAYYRDTNTEHYLFIVGDFKNARGIYAKLQELPLFKKVWFLPGNYKRNMLYEAIILKKNTYTIQKLLKRYLLPKDTRLNVFIFNDRRPEDQLLMYLNKKYYRGVNYYVEDGIAIYADMGGLRSIHPVEKILRKLYFGFWYTPVNILGTSEYIDIVLATEPTLVIDSIKIRHPVLKINKSIFDGVVKSGVVEQVFVLDDSIKNKIMSSKKVALVLVPHSSVLAKGMKRKYCEHTAKIITHLLQENYEVLLKHHPRERLEDITYLCNMHYVKNNITVIPRNIPIEIVYFLLRNRENVVIYGFPSSAILTARLILGLDKKKKIISFWDDSFNVELKKVFKKLSISVNEQ